MDSLTFLEHIDRIEAQPVYVLHGDEDFLKRRVLTALRDALLGEEGNAFAFSAHAGDKATFAAVSDELHTLPFLSPRRLVCVEGADPFVTRYRAVLEQYVAAPATAGVLVLDVKSWPATTRLAKLVDSEATIVCKAPPAYKLPAWCVQWATSQYQKQLSTPAARMLMDLVGADMGQLDQELAKLSIYVGGAARIDADDVDKLVGASRFENVWKLFDAIGNAQPGEALRILDRVVGQGEDPIRILAAFSMQLRRLAQAARLQQQGRPLAVVLEEVGIPSFAVKGCIQQLQYLGRRRSDRLYDWLLEVDLGLKGSSALPPRTLLERLVIRLAASPPKPRVHNRGA